MGVLQYRKGKEHGYMGIHRLAHRDGRPYNGRSDQRSYDNGYAEGIQAKTRQMAELKSWYLRNVGEVPLFFKPQRRA